MVYFAIIDLLMLRSYAERKQANEHNFVFRVLGLRRNLSCVALRSCLGF